MQNDIFVGLDGEFSFEIDFPRVLTDDERFRGEWVGSTRRGVESRAQTLSHERLPSGRYKITGEILLPIVPGAYENTVSEVCDLSGNPIEQVRPRFPSLLAPGFVGAENKSEH